MKCLRKYNKLNFKTLKLSNKDTYFQIVAEQVNEIFESNILVLCLLRIEINKLHHYQ